MWPRRGFIIAASQAASQAAWAAAWAVSALPTLGAGRAPEKSRPQIGDRLVYAFGDRQGTTLRDDDIALDAGPISAYPFDAASGVVRDGSRLNLVAVLRTDPATFTPPTARYATPDGLIAYSSVCTHTGCTVEEWHRQAHRLVCVCHGSEFVVADAGRVVTGPAPKPLAMLPLEVIDGEIAVAGAFSRRVGAQPTF